MKIHIEMRLSLYAANFNGILGFDFFIFSDGLYLLFAWDFGFELLTSLFYSSIPQIFWDYGMKCLLHFPLAYYAIFRWDYGMKYLLHFPLVYYIYLSLGLLVL